MRDPNVFKKLSEEEMGEIAEDRHVEVVAKTANDVPRVVRCTNANATLVVGGEVLPIEFEAEWSGE